jgi:hypothetical protein
MLRAKSDPDHQWRAVSWVVCAFLVLVIILLVPPGTIPDRPGVHITDADIQHWPNAFFLRESVLERGQWPFWNPLHMLGQPFAANPLAKVWYPPQWLVLLIPPTLHLDFLIYAHMALLALGMFAWARGGGLSLPAAAFGALAWGLNPKLIAHLGAGHLDIFYALAWLPWLLWAARRLAGRPTAGRGACLAGVAALLALADLRIAFYMLPLAALYGGLVFFEAGRGKSGRSPIPLLKSGGVAVGLFLLLTAVQTIPLMALGPRLTRALITPEETAIFSLPPAYLLGMLFAYTQGIHEWMTYVGLPVIALATLALSSRRRQISAVVLWGVILLSILWALGDNGPLFMPIIRLAPLVGWFRVPPRVWFVVDICLVILSVWGLDRLMRHRLGRWGRVVALAMGFGGLVWTVTTIVVLPDLPGSFVGVGLALLGTGMGLWIAGGSATRASATSTEGEIAVAPIGRTAGLAVLLLTLAVSLLLVDMTQIRGRPLAEIDAHDQLLIDALGPAPGMIYSPSFELLGPAAARAGLMTLHGNDPFQLQTHAEIIGRAAGVELRGYGPSAPYLPPGEDGVDPMRDVQPDYGLLAALGVEWIVARFPMEDESLRLYDRVDGSYIYRLEAQASDQECCEGLDQTYRPVADLIGLSITGLTLAGLGVWAIASRRASA